jgi:tryptophan synthase alpha subunit
VKKFKISPINLGIPFSNFVEDGTQIQTPERELLFAVMSGGEM